MVESGVDACASDTRASGGDWMQGNINCIDHSQTLSKNVSM